MPCEQKETQNAKKSFKNKFLCLKTKQNTEMSDEEHLQSEFYHPKEQETAGMNASPRGRHFNIARSIQ